VRANAHLSAITTKRVARFVSAAVLLVVVSWLAASSAAASQRYCGTFTARGHTLYTYGLRGGLGCTDVRNILKAWFIDANHTQRYGRGGRWFCTDSHGPALLQGQIERCSTQSGSLIADYDHRL
jgi:hypothetical protein